MFAWQFWGKAIRERLLRTLLLALEGALLFLLELWVLECLLEWRFAFIVELPTAMMGISFCFFYLLGGFRLAVWGAGAIGKYLGILIALHMLPPPWNLIGFAAVLAVMLARGQWKKMQLKQELLQADPDLTEAQAAEIVDTAASAVSNTSDDIRREADTVMGAGLLPVIDAAGRRRRHYLMSLREDACKLYVFDSQHRIQNLVLGEPVEPVGGDLTIPVHAIKEVTLSMVRRGLVRALCITVHTLQRDYIYTPTGSASAAQVAMYFSASWDIPIGNRVEADREPLMQLPEAAEGIRKADTETVARMRSSRRVSTLLTVLSFVSMSFVLLGIPFPILFFVLLLIPVAATAFYIRRQDDVRLDGSLLGKSSISYAYLWNPGFTGVILLAIVLSRGWSVPPACWVSGVLGAVLFALWALCSVRELRRGVWKKTGILFFAVTFGLQIAVVASLSPLLLRRFF